MKLLYDAFPELAATILDWWESVALAICIIGLFINFFFTMHKGKTYRTAFVSLLVCLISLLYVDVITPAQKLIQADDMLRPIMYSSWAYTVWTRAWIYLDYFIQLRGQYEATIEQVLSAENTVVPWRETAQFGLEMERWQNWVTKTIAAIFIIGLLYSNVNKIEALQIKNIETTQAARKEDRESKELAASLKRQQDSLFLEGVIAERRRVELFLSKLDATLQNSTVNKNLLFQERRDKQKLLDNLKALQQSINARLQPIPTLPARTPASWQIPTEKVQPIQPPRRKGAFGFEEDFHQDSSFFYVRAYP